MLCGLCSSVIVEPLVFLRYDARSRESCHNRLPYSTWYVINPAFYIYFYIFFCCCPLVAMLFFLKNWFDIYAAHDRPLDPPSADGVQFLLCTKYGILLLIHLGLMSVSIKSIWTPCTFSYTVITLHVRLQLPIDLQILEYKILSIRRGPSKMPQIIHSCL